MVGILLPPQAGTEVCVKNVVPQTGKAENGFCPKVVQACDQALVVSTLKINKKNMSLPTNRINVKVFHSIVGSGWFFQENVNIKREADATFPSSFKTPCSIF